MCCGFVAILVIGAHKTNDVPPVYFFRVKNPHTKLAGENGSPELEAQPHRKVEGYDIIAEGDVTENERGIMTAGRLTDMNGIKDKSKIDEVAERMFNNKAFRKIANDSNITRITSPDKGQVEQHLKKIESNLKGRGVDKGIDMATMKPKTGSAL